MNNKSTYTIEYAIKRVRDAIELAEIEGNFQPVRLAVNDLEDAINAEIKDADSKDHEDTVRSVVSSFYQF